MMIKKLINQYQKPKIIQSEPINLLQVIGLPFIAAALNVFSFAPFSFYILSWLLPGLLWFLVDHLNKKRPLTTAWFFGMGYFATSIAWIRFAVNQVTYQPGAGWLVWGLLIATLAAIFVVQIALWNRIKTKIKPFLYPVVFAILWCLNEWLRSYLLGGFPWLWVAYSQSESPLNGWLPLIGSPGVSLMVVTFSVWIVMRLVNQARTIALSLPIVSLFFFCCVGLWSRQHAWTERIDQGINVALVQGNVSLQEKWNSLYYQQNFERYLALSKPYTQADVLIWPEAALPGTWQENDLKTLQFKWYKNNSKAEWITGIFLADKKGMDVHYRNAIVAIEPKQIHLYSKRRLVPFGEYTPLSGILGLIKQWIVFPMADLTPGSNHQENFHVKGLSIAPFVCYEIAFPDLMAQVADANLLLVVTDDVWFGRSFAAAQHLQIAKIRALETGRPIIFSSNTGITALINERGVVEKSLPVGQGGVLSRYVQGYKGKTPYVQFISGVGLLF